MVAMGYQSGRTLLDSSDETVKKTLQKLLCCDHFFLAYLTVEGCGVANVMAVRAI